MGTNYKIDYKLDHYMLNATGAVFTLDEIEDLYESEDVNFTNYVNSEKFDEDFTKVYPKNIENINDTASNSWFSYDDAFKTLNKIIKSLDFKDWEVNDGEWFLIDLKNQKKNITSIMCDIIENVGAYCTDEKKITFDE